ncbi:hypothetical protein L249_3148 [Ophiocordyceps polyrhachis-furcata BCC 54312]|uniref:Zn(2)-C6 fungal-type domain-containing protein n=1 Tax=Ophiocordyceps polyrhachis-furcata BCC 54312 TaxID=1330021 RepID=A0A367LPN3_9HYPO|nr:hypothetical protein L249_3148 [Ophiocordyceps polyrhachis-furcata BCC 54312]
MQNLRRAYDPITARSNLHQACDRCHEKKLKCSGDKEGCDRCATSGHPCKYKRPRSRSSRKNNSNRSDPEPTESSRRGRETMSHQHQHQHVSPPRRTPPAASKPRSHAARIGSPLPAAPTTTQQTVPYWEEAGLAVANQSVFGDQGLAGGYGLHLFPSQHLAPGPQDWTTDGPYAATASDATYSAAESQVYDFGPSQMAFDSFPVFEDYQAFDPRYWAPGRP